MSQTHNRKPSQVPQRRMQFNTLDSFSGQSSTSFSNHGPTEKESRSDCA